MKGAVKGKHLPASKIARILHKLKTQGQASNRELNQICFRYSARLAELRSEGHNILTVDQHDGKARFVYLGHSDDEVKP